MGDNTAKHRGATALLLAAASALAACDTAYNTLVKGEPLILARDWKESAPQIPPYPEEQDWVSLSADLVPRGYEFRIVPSSVSKLEDGVIRYTAGVRSPSGAGTVLYEGIHCLKRQYKTYAFGTVSQTFKPAVEPEWRPISPRGRTAFRRVLLDRYVCDERGLPKEVDEVLARLDKPIWAWRPTAPEEERESKD